MNSKLGYFVKEEGLLEEVSAEGVRLIMVIGGSDTGKTTLVEGLADFLSGSFPTGVADLDMGQSHIGPPATLAWGKVAGGFKRWHDIDIEDFYFTGAVSPPGNLLPALAGAKHIVEAAARKCGKLVIDTTGLIAEPVGRVLKEYKIELLAPDLILALQRGDELEGILGHLRFRKRPAVKRLAVPKEVILKSAALRSDYRGLKFKEYFSGSRTVEVSEANTGIRFTREAAGADLAGRIVSFRDGDNRDLALGIIERAVDAEGWYLVKTPLSEGARFTTLVIGSAFAAM